MSDTPEQDRLKRRLLEMWGIEQLQDFHVTWGPLAAQATEEERAKAVNQAFDAIDAGDYEVIEGFDDSQRDHVIPVDQTSPRS